MSALTDQWLLVHSASVACQNTQLDIDSAGCEGNTTQRDARVAVFQELQASQIEDLDAKIQALQVLLVSP